MELRQLVHFAQICKDKSFKVAADTLFISQQGISSSILRLEDELGVRLLNRCLQARHPPKTAFTY
jgi:DNA-binding transcriptional LysR family regulator